MGHSIAIEDRSVSWMLGKLTLILGLNRRLCRTHHRTAGQHLSHLQHRHGKLLQQRLKANWNGRTSLHDVGGGRGELHCESSLAPVDTARQGPNFNWLFWSLSDRGRRPLNWRLRWALGAQVGRLRGPAPTVPTRRVIGRFRAGGRRWQAVNAVLPLLFQRRKVEGGRLLQHNPNHVTSPSRPCFASFSLTRVFPV